jgi:hypothetical protein
MGEHPASLEAHGYVWMSSSSAVPMHIKVLAHSYMETLAFEIGSFCHYNFKKSQTLENDRIVQRSQGPYLRNV